MYFTIVIPFVPRQYATPMHPTEETGPFATLTRGAFPDIGSAIEWARTHLNGTPYTIRFVPDHTRS